MLRHHKIFIVTIVLGIFLSLEIARADVLIGNYVPVERPKNVGSCVYFLGFENNTEYNFFAEMVSKTKEYEQNWRQYIEPIKDNICYPLYPGSIFRDYWATAKPGRYFDGLRMVNKKFVSAAEYDKILTVDLNSKTEHKVESDIYGRWFVTALNASEIVRPVWQPVKVVSYLYAPTSSLGSDFESVPFFDVKSNSNITAISPVIIYRAATTIAPTIYTEVADKDFNRTVFAVTPDQAMQLSARGQDDQGRNLLAIGFKDGQEYQLSFDKQYDVNFLDGSQKTYSQSDFDQLLAANRPEYKYEVYSPSPRVVISPPVLIASAIINYVWPLLLTIIIEFLIFFWFGSRRIRNYLWFLVVNVISYPIGLFTVFILKESFYQLDILSANTIGSILLIWFIAEFLVVLIEYSIMWLGLRRCYPAKQIALFVFVANAVTALIGLAISIYMTLT